MLATPADAVPSGEGWLHEVKWDGYRAIVTIAGGVAELTSRNGKSLTARFEPVARAVVQAVKTPDCVLDGEVCALDDRGPGELLGDAAGVWSARALPLRRARDRRGAARRAAARGAARAPPGADRQAQQDGSRLRSVRRRRRALRGRHGAEARGHRQQAGGLALRVGAPQPQLAQDQDAGAAGARRRRVHEGAGAPLERLRRARARRQRERRPPLGRQRRHRLRRGRDRAAARQAEAAAARRDAVRRAAEDAESAQGGRRLGRADARRRDPLRRVDARRPAAGTGLRGAARGQGGE